MVKFLNKIAISVRAPYITTTGLAIYLIKVPASASKMLPYSNADYRDSSEGTDRPVALLSLTRGVYGKSRFHKRHANSESTNECAHAQSELSHRSPHM